MRRWLFLLTLFLTTTAYAQNFRTGMTWRVLGTSGGYTHVGADGQTNPYSGDTTADQSLPVLCVNVDGQAAPSGIAFDFHNGWLRGSVAATAPVQGIVLGSQEAADGVCRDSFGSAWRMAEFHDGRYGSDFSLSGGWSFWGAGSLPSGTRFWASINDQPANPWNSVPAGLAQVKGMLDNLVSPVLSFSQNPTFRDIVRNGVAAQFDGDTNVLLSDVIAQAEAWGAVDPYSYEWQSFVSQVNSFSNVNGQTYYPQIYIPNYGDVWFPDGNVTLVVVDFNADVESVPAYQIDAYGNTTYIGYVDEAYAASNEVWVLSTNERIGMDPQAFRTLRQLDAAGMTSRNASFAKSFAMKTDSLNCNPTGLRNNKGLEYLTRFRFTTLKRIESWLQGKLEVRLIVLGRGGAELANQPWNDIKRATATSSNGVVVEEFITTWDRAAIGDTMYYRWIEEDWGPPITLTLGLPEAVRALLQIPVSVSISTTFAPVHDNIGGQTVNFDESTYIEYSAGSLRFYLCTIGGDGHPGDNNFARSAIVAASSTFSGYSPQRVNDGNRSTALGGGTSWCNTGYGSGYPPQWLQLDFGVNRTFSRVDLYTSSGYAIRDYDVQYFVQPTGWITVAQVRNNTALQVTSNFAPVTARLVRILTLSGPTHQPGFTRINELEVY
ncbi:MAG TPA: discoidin domain-containing protein [Thermoanaerobaculia bacterium]